MRMRLGRPSAFRVGWSSNGSNRSRRHPQVGPVVRRLCPQRGRLRYARTQANTVSEIEQGARWPSLAVLLRISHVLGVGISVDHDGRVRLDGAAAQAADTARSWVIESRTVLAVSVAKYWNDCGGRATPRSPARHIGWAGARTSPTRIPVPLALAP